MVAERGVEKNARGREGKKGFPEEGILTLCGGGGK